MGEELSSRSSSTFTSCFSRKLRALRQVLQVFFQMKRTGLGMGPISYRSFAQLSTRCAIAGPGASRYDSTRCPVDPAWGIEAPERRGQGDSSMLQITEKAAEKVKEIRTAEGIEEAM